MTQTNVQVNCPRAQAAFGIADWELSTSWKIVKSSDSELNGTSYAFFGSWLERHLVTACSLWVPWHLLGEPGLESKALGQFFSSAELSF